MRIMLIAALVAAPLTNTAAAAATLENAGPLHTQTGAFAGARVRIGFGGRESGKMRAGLTLAPTRSGAYQDGRLVTAFGDGMEFGFNQRALGLSVAGQRIDGDRLGADSEKKRKRGIPTWALVIGGGLAAVGIGLAVWADAISDNSE